MLSLNWIDYLMLAVFVFYAYEGYVRGFIRGLLDLIIFTLSFLAGLRLYGFVAEILTSKFSLSLGLSDAIGFFIAAFLAEIIIKMLIRILLPFDLTFSKSFNSILGILPGILSGAILATFVLILIIAFPTTAPIKHAVSNSKVGTLLLSSAQGWERQLNKVFGVAINETINFLTVEPKANEIVSLNFKTKYTLPDSISEQQMFQLVNKERVSRGLMELMFDNKLRDVGRKHCEDMFKRGYFSHYTPEGLSPFDRMDEAGIIYASAGENLAMSPNTDIAMQGLMNSQGHKAIILSTDFRRIGIGVIEGEIYGEMFCQEFAN